MTAKEKASELYSKHFHVNAKSTPMSIQHALISVDEVMKFMKTDELEYLEEVKQELLKIQASQITVRDWVYKATEKRLISVRLFNILTRGWRYKDDIEIISDITRDEFLSVRNAGEKTWDEFSRLREALK